MGGSTILIGALIAYLIGSIPFGYLLVLLTSGDDIRSSGSGNIGATNVLRSGRKGLAAATLLLDALKGLVAVVVAGDFLPGAQPVAAIAVLAGHCFPVWLRFRGGKGVATYAGVAFAVATPVGAIFAGVWVLVLAIGRISSLGGMAAAAAAPAAALVFDRAWYVPVLILMTLIVLFQHRANIARLARGEEPRIGSKR